MELDQKIASAPATLLLEYQWWYVVNFCGKILHYCSNAKSLKVSISVDRPSRSICLTEMDNKPPFCFLYSPFCIPCCHLIVCNKVALLSGGHPRFKNLNEIHTYRLAGLWNPVSVSPSASSNQTGYPATLIPCTLEHFFQRCIKVLLSFHSFSVHNLKWQAFSREWNTLKNQCITTPPSFHHQQYVSSLICSIQTVTTLAAAAPLWHGTESKVQFKNVSN